MVKQHGNIRHAVGTAARVCRTKVCAFFRFAGILKPRASLGRHTLARHPLFRCRGNCLFFIFPTIKTKGGNRFLHNKGRLKFSDGLCCALFRRRTDGLQFAQT
ncbi:hypothetical protein [Kingella potus]|uniref:hypothetical protein n=1 Tax=Kingella potus TaxID=265175 RepID=UPI003D1E52CF